MITVFVKFTPPPEFHSGFLDRSNFIGETKLENFDSECNSRNRYQFDVTKGPGKYSSLALAMPHLAGAQSLTAFRCACSQMEPQRSLAPTSDWG